MNIEFFPGGKRPGVEVNHSPPSSDEVKNERSHTSAVHIHLRGVDKEKKIKSIACLKSNKWNVTTPSTYSFSFSSSDSSPPLSAPPPPSPSPSLFLLLHLLSVLLYAAADSSFGCGHGPFGVGIIFFNFSTPCI